MRQYRARFQPSLKLAAPAANMALVVLRADTEAAQLELLRSGQGQPARSLSWPDCSGRLVVWLLRANSPGRPASHLVAVPPSQVRGRQLALATTCEVEQLSSTIITASFADRPRSYELLAQVF